MISHKMKISLVIPVYNEENNLLPLYNAIREVLDSIEYNWQVTFVDDSSTDASLLVLK
jgi:glycosyltransferase involved in cell wall biosynthesis